MEIKTRQQAAKDGDKQFYTGKACRRGHKTTRYVCNDVCVTCNTLNIAAYRKKIKAMIKGVE